MNDREKLLTKIIIHIMANHKNKKTPDYISDMEMIKLLDNIRKTQHSSISFDAMVTMIAQLSEVCNDVMKTSKYFF